MQDSYNKIFKSVNKILVVLAHPDDAEIYAGGTIARLIADGKKIRVVKMTNGNKGSRKENISEIELTKLRLTEDQEAMQTLKIHKDNNIYLNLGDGDVSANITTIEKLVFQIREFQPDLIITHNPEDYIIKFDSDNSWVNHTDHRYTGQATIDAAYPFSRDILFFPEHFKNKSLKSHSALKFLLVDYYNHEDTIAIDITTFKDVRTKAISCHSSQYDLEAAEISTSFFTKLDSSGKNYERFRYVEID